MWPNTAGRPRPRSGSARRRPAARRGGRRRSGWRDRGARRWAGRAGGPGGQRWRGDDRGQPGRRADQGVPGAAVRVVIAEDAVLLREGLCRLLTDKGHEVVAAVSDADALVAAVRQSTPDLAVVDIRLPPGFTDEGLRAARTIRAASPEVGVLLLSQYVVDRYLDDLLGPATGGIGYLLKDRIADVGDFLRAVDQVGAGGTVLDSEVVAPTAGPQPPAQPPRRAHRPRARRARGHGRGPFQRLDLRRAAHLGGLGREARGQHLRQARPGKRPADSSARPRRGGLPALVAASRTPAVVRRAVTEPSVVRRSSDPRATPATLPAAEHGRTAPGGAVRPRTSGCPECRQGGSVEPTQSLSSTRPNFSTRTAAGAVLAALMVAGVIAAPAPGDSRCIDH